MAKRLQASVIYLQGEFLKIVAEVSLETVADLFERALDLFNALRLYPLSFFNQEASITDLVMYGSLRDDAFWGTPSSEARGFATGSH